MSMKPYLCTLIELILRILLLYLGGLLLFSGCYSFKGFSIAPELETFRVESFEIDPRASIAPPTAGIDFAQQLQDKIRNETRLRFKTEEPDIIFTGRIREFEVRAVAPRPGEVSAANQLLITVQVEYTDSKNEANNWQSQWTQYAEFDANADLLSVQTQLISQVNKLLLEDIFNRSFNNW
jgi:Lipopolysaccharide-assembly